MPLPLLLAGGALLAGGWGVKKGFDAKEDFNKAEEYNKDAKRIYNNAHDQLTSERNHTKHKLENLGRIKARIYQEALVPFVKTFEKIKNVDFKDKKIKDELGLSGIASENAMISVREASFHASDVFQSGVAALGAGGLAGFGAFGGAGLLATASTGTAIGSLTGVAATNATLAWFGGGSLAAGGMGMAGGTAVLGGIVAGPVLAIGGMILASKAEAAKENALANLSKARVAAEEIKTAATAVRGIRNRVNEISQVLEKLEPPFMDFLEGLKLLVAHSNHYPSYKTHEKQSVMMAASLAITLKNVMETPVIDKEGSVTQASKKAINDANIFRNKLSDSLTNNNSSSYEKKCPQCSAIFDSDHKWCGACGAKL